MMKSSWLVAPLDIFAFRPVGVGEETENLSSDDPFCCL